MPQIAPRCHAMPSAEASEDSLAELMSSYPCYAFVANAECTAARALFRGRWNWSDVRNYLVGKVATIVVNDERASGFLRYRLYGWDAGCLAEVEVYFARGDGRTSFWCQTDEVAGQLGLAA